ncbi:MAG TPA: pyridoxal phosphate-dependent aminotransferase [Geminicoccus sp.]|jgi:aspartate/methionine/tyrosine aminotransferase|uniref:pyridoxal phosphate-dependent aminotransferase n=1 Tax=Geminicoccus sp. TaxID=2024832 RepID=UPI002E2F4912|nr:pyridoxal phosphate-dependent aminotransferase [Geminicoccus sp.]HEX2525725.1 pyridoxal phosphate-dependent aminotransferase [Geminicoccus sp.]
MIRRRFEEGEEMRIAACMHRLGTESAFEVLARAVRLQAQGKSIVNLGIGQPDFPTPPHIVEAAIKALRDGHHGYTPANGILKLREAVAADMHRHRNVIVDPDQILVVPGGKVTMFFAIQMFGEAGAEIMYPDPGFPIYRSAIEFTGAKAVPIPLLEEKGFSFSAEDVLGRITPATRLIIVNSPANPTGGVVPKEELDRLVEGLRAHPEVAIMSDEIYARMVYDGQPHASLTAYPEIQDRLILLDGWSKTYAMTGWRMGWGVWPKPLIDLATRLAINVHSCVNASAQYAGIAALEGPQDSVDMMMAAFAERRKVIVERLNQLPGFSCVNPGGAFYAFPNITGTGKSSRVLQDEILNEAGVALISGTSFGIHGEGYLRFSYAASVEAIEEACARIQRYLDR